MRAGVARLFTLLFLLIFSPVAGAGQDTALRGVALVIGQSKYENLAVLANPANDARAVEDLLLKLGFTVEGVQDRKAKRLRSDLDNFAEEAEGADVALVYYSGHAIEAGGENWLIPTDAGVEALADPRASLLPLSEIIETLRGKAKIVIALFDACRTNPFPPGTQFMTGQGGGAVAAAAQGLGAPRGFTAATEDGADAESLGALVGYAAAPGQVALDGEADGNSPYAAALLKHISAPGAEFGLVMTMVAEEVYLNTKGAQQPWTNAGLRRLLYFGKAGEEVEGDEALLKAGRRQLLLTISALPRDMRQTVEQLARQDNLPLAPLYGMLKQLQVDTAAGPEEIDKQLRAGAENLKKLLATRDTIQRSDPEIIRLTELGDRAQDEGAIKLALDYRAQASLRAKDVSKALKDTESQLRDRHREVAATFAKEAETALLAFEHAKAAENYALAVAEVENWDRGLAWEYIRLHGNAWSERGDFLADEASFRKAAEVYREGIRRYPRDASPENWAKLTNNLAGTLVSLGELNGAPGEIEEAISAYRGVLEVLTLERDRMAWATAQNNLGNALRAVGESEAGPERLEEAVNALRMALGVLKPEDSSLLWVGATNNLGTALIELGRRKQDPEMAREAAAILREAAKSPVLEGNPYVWVITRINLGNALSQLGDQLGDIAVFEQAAAELRNALGKVNKTHFPNNWAAINNNLASVLVTLGERKNDVAELEEALRADKAALEVWTRERQPRNWAISQSNLGDALRALGLREAGTARLIESVAAYRASLEERTRARDPFDWSRTQNFLGLTLQALGERENNPARFEEAISAYREALKERSPARSLADWGVSMDNLGRALFAAGSRQPDTARLLEALAVYDGLLKTWAPSASGYERAGVHNKRGKLLHEIGYREAGVGRMNQAADAYRLALAEWTQAKHPADWAMAQNNLGLALHGIGERTGDPAKLKEAAGHFRDAASVWTVEAAPLDWATAQDNLGWTLGLLGENSGDSAMVLEGRNAVQAAWDTVKATGNTSYDSYFSNRLQAFDRSLAGLR